MNYEFTVQPTSRPFRVLFIRGKPFFEHDVQMSFREQEGMTYIVSEQCAQNAGIAIEERWAMISVDTVTSLSATGITAHISTVLASHKIPCNMVAAFYHDHFFVPFDLCEEALVVLRA